MANTKQRKQFNCYIRDEYIDLLRGVAAQQKKPAGEVVEAMLDVFILRNIGSLTERLSELIGNGNLTAQQQTQLQQLSRLLKATVEEIPAS